MHEETTIPELTEVVAHVAALLGPREGAVTALDGGIDRESECVANTHAGKLGIAPPVAAFLESPPCLITRFVEGRKLSPEELLRRAAGGGS